MIVASAGQQETPLASCREGSLRYGLARSSAGYPGADATARHRPITQTMQSRPKPWVAGIPSPLGLWALDVSAIWGKLIGA